MLGQQLNILFLGSFDSIDLSFSLTIVYISKGPRFDPEENREPDVLYQSVIEKGFSFKVPNVLAAQQHVTKVSLNTDSISSSFVYDPDLQILTIKPNIE